MRSSVDGAAWPFVEVSRQLVASVDWHSRVNGHSGFEPPALPLVSAALNTFPSMQSFDVLDRYGVRYVVLRTTLPIPIGRDREQTYAKDGVGVVSDARAWAMIAAIPSDRLVSAEHIGSAYLIELARP
jgi:hypothetical protein